MVFGINLAQGITKSSYLYDPFASRILAVETQSSFTSQALMDRLVLLVIVSSTAIAMDGNASAEVAAIVAKADERNAFLEHSPLGDTTEPSKEVVVETLWLKVLDVAG